MKSMSTMSLSSFQIALSLVIGSTLAQPLAMYSSWSVAELMHTLYGKEFFVASGSHTEAITKTLVAKVEG